MSLWRRFDIRQAGRRLVIVLGALAAANLAFYVMLVQPERRAYREIVTNETPKFKLLNERRRQVEKREGFLEAVHRAKQDLTSLNDDILATRERRLVEVQQEVAALCEEFGIAYNSVNYSNSMLPEVGLDRLGMNVPLEGNYGSLRKFLQAVERSSRFLLVEKVSLSKGKQGGKLLSLNISMATYFYLSDESMELAAAERRRG
jgi:Tfp pilus assembly protein PilO